MLVSAAKQAWNNPYSRYATLSAVGGPIFTSWFSNIYSNQLQRDFYQYQKNAYERQLADWNKYVGSQGKTIQYPELSYPGRIRSMDLGISQSYAADARATASAERSIGFAAAGGYRSSRTLYGKSTGRSSRYL